MPPKRIGKLPARYRFALNPFPEVRWSKCPRCEKPMHARKCPLLVHVEGHGPLVLGKTCRYCTPCEFILAHQAELEDELAYLFSRRKPEVVGNPYFVLGVVERTFWKKGLTGTLDLNKTLEHTADIKRYMTLRDPRRHWVYTGAERERGESDAAGAGPSREL